MKKTKVIFTLVVAAACVLSVQVTKTFILPKIQVQLDKRTFHRSKGEPSYPVWVVEYFDFQCGSCRQASYEMKEYMSKHPGKIFLQVRFFPIQGHSHGLRSAIYGECAAEQNKFWDFYDLVFEKQPEWSALKDIEAIFHDYAKSARIDIKKLDVCVEDPKTEQAVAGEKQKAKDLGINTTPTFFIRGKMVTGIKNAIEELDKELKR